MNPQIVEAICWCVFGTNLVICGTYFLVHLLGTVRAEAQAEVQTQIAVVGESDDDDWPTVENPNAGTESKG